MDSTFTLPKDYSKPWTDYTRWRLKADDGGRHVWQYLRSDEEVSEWPQSSLEKYWLGLETVRPFQPWSSSD
jgi:lanosterol synthase